MPANRAKQEINTDRKGKKETTMTAKNNIISRQRKNRSHCLHGGQNKNLLPVRVPVWKAKTTTTKILGNENAKQEKKPFKTGETRNHFVQKGINKCRQHTCRKCKTIIYYLQKGQKELSAKPEMSEQINLKLYLQKGLTRNRYLQK